MLAEDEHTDERTALEGGPCKSPWGCERNRGAIADCVAGRGKCGAKKN